MYDRREDSFVYNSGLASEYNMSSIIMNVHLSVTDDKYSLADEDKKRLDDFINNLAVRPTRRISNPRVIQESAVTGEGLVVEVHPPTTLADGPRTSGRIRRQRIFID